MEKIANNIFCYKKEMMGLAIILIMLFHLAIPTLGGLKKLCEIGVDVFLFLGGFTCSLSYLSSLSSNKENSKIVYYKKRFWRVLPPFFLLYLFIYGYEFLIMRSGDWSGFFANITMWKNIVDNSLRMWYIPAVLLMYMLLPFYVDACRKWKNIMWFPFLWVLIMIIAELTHYMDFIPFKMACVRLPIFLLGINIFLVRNREFKINKAVLIMVAVLFLFFAWKIQDYSANLRRFCFIPVVIALVYYFDKLKSTTIKRFLLFMGGMTLELYLIHEYTQQVLSQFFSIETFLMRLQTPFIRSHALGLQGLFNALLSLPLGIFIAYVYQSVLRKILYSK